MSKKRYVDTKFWDDSYVIDLDPIEKLLFLYFLTNPLTNITGIYEIALRRIAFDTGIDRDMIVKILTRFEASAKIYYREGWVVVRNFIKNQAVNPKVAAGIRDELARVPESLRDLIEFEYIPRDTPKRTPLTKAQRSAILDRDQCCLFCGATDQLEIDHIVPIATGGDNRPSNLRVLCRTCNGKRNAELRWDSNGNVTSSDSVPKKMGSLSHSIKLNTDSIKLNTDSTETRDKRVELTYPLAQLFQAFPDIRLTPAQCGMIEQEVTAADADAWSQTIRKYVQNHDPYLGRYDPSKVGTVLSVFRDFQKQIAKEKKTNGTTQGKSARSAKPTNREVLEQSADFYANYSEG